MPGSPVPRSDGTEWSTVKIVSLLPSATEIVFALGIGDGLAGVSFECDYPAAARTVPVVSGTVLDTEGSPSVAQIDAEVSARIVAGESIYNLDDGRIRAVIGPDGYPGPGPVPGLCRPVGRRRGGAGRHRLSGRRRVLGPGRAGGSDRLHRASRPGHRNRRGGRDPLWPTCGAGSPWCGAGSRAGPARCSCSSGPTRPSTPATGCPRWWRRPVGSRCWPPLASGRDGSPGTRSPRRRSTSPCSARAASTSPAPWSRPAPSWAAPRCPVSGASSPWTPTPSSPGPGRVWWTASSCCPSCSTRSGPASRPPRTRPPVARLAGPIRNAPGYSPAWTAVTVTVV